MSSSKIIEVTDNKYNIRTRVYQLNKLILITLYSTNIIETLPSGGHLNYLLFGGLPVEIEPLTVMLNTNRGDRFTVTISGGNLVIDYVYNFAEVNYTQIAQQFMYICK